MSAGTKEAENFVKAFLENEVEKRKKGLRENPSQMQGVEVEDILAHSDGSNVTDKEAQDILEYVNDFEDWEKDSNGERVKNVHYTGEGVGINGFDLTLDNDIGSIESEIGGEATDNPLDAIVSVEYGKQVRDEAIRRYNKDKGENIRVHEMPAPIGVMVNEFDGEFNLDNALDRNLDVDDHIQDLIRYVALTDKHGDRMTQIAASGSVQHNQGTEVGEEREADEFVSERFNGDDQASLMSAQAPDLAHFNGSGVFVSEEGDYNMVFSRGRELLYDLAFSDSEQVMRNEGDNGDKFEQTWKKLGHEDVEVKEHGSQGYVNALEEAEGVKDLVEYQMDIPCIMLTPEAGEVVDGEGNFLDESEEYDSEDSVPIVVGDSEEGIEARVSFTDIVENQGAVGYIPGEDDEGNLELTQVEWCPDHDNQSKTMQKLSDQMNTHHITFSWEDLNLMFDREEKRYPGSSPYWKQIVLASAAQNERTEETIELYSETGLGEDEAAWETRKAVDKNGVDAKLPNGMKVRDYSDRKRENHVKGIEQAFNPEQASLVYSALKEEELDYKEEFNEFNELVDWAVEKIYWEEKQYERADVPEEEQEEFWSWVAEVGYGEEVEELQEEYGSVSKMFAEELNQNGLEGLLQAAQRTYPGE